jgi:ABC-type nickel/cobalt efflux system permease component RcnA
MKLKAFALLIAALMAFSCTNKKQKEKETTEKQKQDQTEILEVTKVTNQPENYTDKKITVKGMVTHVCRHGGKKLHISASESDQKLRIKAGKNMSAFEREMEGSTVKVTGKFIEERIDQAYIEKLKKGDSGEHHDHAEENHEHAHKDTSKATKEAQGVSEAYIKELEQKINNSEKGYISEYWLIAEKVEKQTK